MTDSTKTIPSGFLPLKEAAKRAGRSVRSVQRWIEEGRVESIQHPADRRQRLVSLAGLEKMHEQAEAALDLDEERRRQVAIERAAIMEVAKGVSRYVATASGELGDRWREPTDDELSHSRFVRDLQSLFAAVNGEIQDPPAILGPALERVLTALHINPLTGRIQVPDDFWGGSLVGRYLARARLLFFRSETLIGLNDIAERLALPRTRVENLLKVRRADRIYDPDDERWLYKSDEIMAVHYLNTTYRSKRFAGLELPGSAESERPDAAWPALPLLPMENRTRFRAVRRSYQQKHFPNAQH